MTWVGFAPPATRYPLSSLPSACFQSGCRPSRDGGQAGRVVLGCIQTIFYEWLHELSPLSARWAWPRFRSKLATHVFCFRCCQKAQRKRTRTRERKRGEGGTIIIGNKRQTHDTSRCICWSSPKGACASGRGIWLLICTAFCLRFYGLWRLSALWFMLYLCLRFSPQLTRWLGVVFNWKPNCWHSKWERGGKGGETGTGTSSVRFGQPL